MLSDAARENPDSLGQQNVLKTVLLLSRGESAVFPPCSCVCHRGMATARAEDQKGTQDG